MIDFDKNIDRKIEKCRKWDKKKIEETFTCSDDFIPMWIADMDFQMADPIKEELKNTIDIGVLGYTYVYDEFFEAVINWHKKRRNNNIKKEWITLSYGTVSTLHYLIQGFCKKEDYVLMNTPVYGPFDQSTKRQNCNSVYNELKIYNNRYEIDWEDLEYKLSKYKPKLYLFCSPHNPSGRVWDKDEIDKVIQICEKHNTILVVDEVHSEQIYANSFYSIAQWLDEEQRIILLTSPNKAFNIGGLKTSYSIISNEKIREQFQNQLIKNSITSPNVFGIKALIAAYDKSAYWLDEMKDYVELNYKYLKEQLDNDRLKSLSIMNMESSFLVWINIEKTGYTSDEFVEKLAIEQGVLLESGTHFVQNGEGWIRMNLGTTRSNIKEACLRIEKFLKDK